MPQLARPVAFFPSRDSAGPRSGSMIRWLPLLFAAALSGCGAFTDAATRLAYDIKANVRNLGRQEGAMLVVQHETPSRSGECEGPYRVLFDKTGALIVWCKDAHGNTVSSHSTSHHARFVDTREKFIVEKLAGSPLLIQLQRQNGRAVITNVF